MSINNENLVTKLTKYTLELNQEDTCTNLLNSCKHYLRALTTVFMSYMNTVNVVSMIMKGQEIDNNTYKPYTDITQATVDTCLPKNELKDFKSEQCGNLCTYLLFDVFTNNNGSTAKDIPIFRENILMENLKTLGDQAVKDFVSVLTYNFDEANTNPTPDANPDAPPQRRLSQKKRNLAAKAEKRKLQAPTPPAPAPTPAPAAIDIKDSNEYLNFAVKFKTDGSGIDLGTHAKNAILVNLNFETIMNDANQNTVTNSFSSLLKIVSGCLIIMLSAIITM